MCRFGKWFLMLNKRLYKKVTFLVILALIPICVFSFSLAARQDSGFLHIVLAQTDSNDALSAQVVDELMNEDSMIQFTKASSPKEAIDAVRAGDADEAWIFPDTMQKKMDEFIENDFKGVVSIVAREQTVFLRLSHEKLTAALYKHCAKAYYIDYVRTNLQELDSLSNQELIAYFDAVSISEELFVFGSSSTVESQESAQQSNYLTTPIRGFLGVLVVLCGMAAVMYYMQDDRFGTFSWISETGKPYIAFCCVIIAVLNVAVMVLLSLFAAGLATDAMRELLSVLLYAVCCTVFCLLLKQIFGSIKLYSAMIPLFIVVMIAVCPIFFDLRSLLAVQLIFPPTYYVNAAYDSNYLLYMLVYSLLGTALYWLLSKWQSKRRV